MKHRVEIQEIVNSNMEQNIASWGELSPTDPLKIFTEGIICSLAEVDKRQDQAIQKMIDTVPTLLGFYPKRSTLVKGLFQIETKASNNRNHKVPKGMRLKYQSKSGQNNHIVFDEQEIQAVELMSVQIEKEFYHLNLKANSPLDSLKVFFLPKGKSASSVLKEVKLSIKSPDQTEKVLHFNDLNILDNSMGLTKTGEIKISLNEGTICDTAGTQIILSLKRSPTSTEGMFYNNLIKGSTCQIKEEATLGRIEGKIWEEIPLPNDLVVPPKKIRVELLTGDIQELTYLEEDILKVKQMDAGKFESSFLYNGIEHCLIIPGAEKLLQNRMGGANITAKNLVFSVSEDDFPTRETKISIEGVEKMIKAVTPIIKISKQLERESKQHFLNRFYRTLRQFYQFANQTNTNMSVDYLKTSVLNVDHHIRSVEISINEENKEVLIYLLTYNPEGGTTGEIDPKLVQKVQAELEKLVPIDYSTYINGFKSKNVNIDLSVKVKVSSQNFDKIDKDSIEKSLINACTDFVLPWPFGQMKVDQGYTRDDLEMVLKEKMPIETDDIEKFDLTLLDNNTLIHIDKIQRSQGEYVNPILNFTVELNDTEAEDEEMILSTNNIDLMDEDEVFDVFS
jgi:hypothetical protein